MSTLKFEVKPFDAIMDKLDTTKIFTVLHEELHDVWVWKEGEAPKAMPKRMINMAYVKVDPMVAKVLYGEKDSDIVDDSEPSEDESSKQPK